MAARDARAGSRATTLTRDSRATRTTRAPRRSQPQQPGIRPHVPHTKAPAARGRLGSQQVVSVRGRRVSTAATASKFSAVSSVALPLLIVGIIAAMVLSGIATAQTFTIQKLQSQERELVNEVESLSRDLEDRRSAARIAQYAEDSGMVVAPEPGIMAVDEQGRAEERRPFNPDSVAKLVDVNGEPTRSGRATSDEAATRELGDSLTQRPGGNVLGGQPPAGQEQPQIANLAPYQPNVAAPR